ncbi:hypothetical protein BGZ68_003373 [Mortierella alpina]|nr:hypothetical protein BGZ68_003373 [Mortierella alpina]
MEFHGPTTAPSQQSSLGNSTHAGAAATQAQPARAPASASTAASLKPQHHRSSSSTAPATRQSLPPASRRPQQSHRQGPVGSTAPNMKPGPALASSSASFQRTPAHSIPRPKKYIGHYDIADRTFQLLSRHRAAACILFWSLTILLDILLQLPIEWFFLFYFILALVFRIFFIGGHIVLISIGAMCVSNAIVFYTVPFSFTSPFATGVAFGLMVSLIHGLNLKGVILAMTMYMLKPYLERQTIITALNPPTVPSIVFLAPLAAFCSAFGVLWLLYDLFGYLHASTDDLRDFFGITLPAPSIVTLKDVKDRSITLSWQCSSQATISKHLIEIDGVIIGESGKQETSVVIQGLYPDNTYRIRLWAITTRNWKTPSDYIVVRTLVSIPVELELSSAENAKLESERVKQLIKESEKPQQAVNAQASGDKVDSTQGGDSGQQDAAPPLEVARTGDSDVSVQVTSSTKHTPTTSTSIHSTSSQDSRISNLTPSVTDEQIAALRIELEGKEAAQALLVQQLADLEKQYKQQEDNLKGEIAALREQQKQEDEPRQQAKAKLKELQDILREAETSKSRVEKEHRIEVDKRQRMTEQLQARQRKLESLQQTLRQCEDKYKSEKESHRQQRQELEATLKKRSEDVKSAEAALKALQASQKTLCSTIETKELELQKLQASLQTPKSHVVWEQKTKDLDLKCAQLTEQLSQYQSENQQLQDRLAEVTKNVAKARTDRETRKAEMEAMMANRAASAAEQTAQTSMDQQNQDHRSSWMAAGWNRSAGTKILNGLFQDDVGTPASRPTPVRKTTGPPPGLSQKSSFSDSGNAGEAGDYGFGGDRRGSSSRGASAAPGSPYRANGQLAGSSLSQQQYAPIVRPRSSSIVSTEYLFMDEPPQGVNGARTATATDLPALALADGADGFKGGRSRNSSVSSMAGFQSPLFEPSFAFSGHHQHQQDSNMYQPPHQNRQMPHGRQHQQQSAVGHSLSPRARFQGATVLHSPPVSHAQYQWERSGAPKSKTGPGVGPVGAGGRFPLVELENKGSPSQSQNFNYHRLFAPTLLSDTSTGTFLDGTGADEHQMNEQNVIKSMFEAPDTLDLRHHLRTVGSHSSLTSQAKILPSHLRSISTPGTSSPLSSPTSAPFQSSPSWDMKAVGRPGTLGRMHSQAEGSSGSLNISDTSSPTSPLVTPFSQAGGTGYGRKSLLKETVDRGVWGTGYGPVTDSRSRHQEASFGSMNVAHSEFSPNTSMEDSKAGSKWYSEHLAHESMLPVTSDPWGQADGRMKPTRVLSGGAGVSMEGMISSPTGSSGSSMDAGTPMSMDALVFADHYFSSRGHRGFDASKSLSSATFPNYTLQQPSQDSLASGPPRTDLANGQNVRRTPQEGGTTGASTNAASGNESDIFGYGLRLNPFGWSIPDVTNTDSTADGA